MSERHSSYLGAKIRAVSFCTGWPMISTAKNAAGNATFQALRKLIKNSSDNPKLIKVINIVIINDNSVDMIAVFTILNLRFILPSISNLIVKISLYD